MKRPQKPAALVALFLLFFALAACKTSNSSKPTCQSDVCIRGVQAAIFDIDLGLERARGLIIFFTLTRPDGSVDQDLGFTGHMKVEVSSMNDGLLGDSNFYFCYVDETKDLAQCRFGPFSGPELANVQANTRVRIRLTPFDFEQVVTLEQMRVQNEESLDSLALWIILAVLGLGVGGYLAVWSFKNIRDHLND